MTDPVLDPPLAFAQHPNVRPGLLNVPPLTPYTYPTESPNIYAARISGERYEDLVSISTTREGALTLLADRLREVRAEEQETHERRREIRRAVRRNRGALERLSRL